MSVTTERRGTVLVIHMDDGRANAVTFELCQAITAAVREAEDDPELKAIVVRGRDGRFSGGFDLGVMRGDDPQAISDLCADGAMLVHTLYSSRVPVVAACTGHALAMGTMIVQGADVRIGPDDDSKIGMTELAIGLSLPDWAITILRERMAPHHVQRALMTARVHTPAEAVAAGLLDEVVAPDSVFDRALEVATQLGDTLDPKARWITLKKLRSDMLDTLAAEAAEFRNGGSL